MLITSSNLASVLAGLPASVEGREEPTAADADSLVLPAAGMAGVVGRVHAGITELLAVEAAAVSGREALVLLEALVAERHRLDAAYLRAVAIADQLEAAAGAGGHSTQGYLKSVLGVSPGRAKADVAAARAVHGGRSKELAAAPVLEGGTLAPLGGLLAGGVVGLTHIDVGVKTLEKIPARLVDEENLETISGFLAQHAPVTTAGEIRVLSDRLIRALEPDADDHYDPESFTRRSFTMATDITGMVHGSYQLDPAAGAQLRAVMDPLSAPKPVQRDENGTVVTRDERTAGQRRADAFGELIRAGSTALAPSSALAPAAGAATGASLGQSGPGLFDLDDCGSAGAAGKLRPFRHQPRVSIVTTMEQLTALRHDDAAGRAAGRSAAGASGPTSPDEPADGPATGPAERAAGGPAGGPAAGFASWITGAGGSDGVFAAADPAPSYCDQLGPISPGTVARMSCDGLFERVVLDARGAVLDLGLSVRLATPAQRRAVTARDHGCIAPGCDRPPGWCEAHHVIWYSRGGPTDVGNLCLLCPAHHSQVHAGLLEVRMIEGIPYARATSADPARARGVLSHPEHNEWIRNGYFDRLKTADHAARTILSRAANP